MTISQQGLDVASTVRRCSSKVATPGGSRRLIARMASSSSVSRLSRLSRNPLGLKRERGWPWNYFWYSRPASNTYCCCNYDASLRGQSVVIWNKANENRASISLSVSLFPLRFYTYLIDAKIRSSFLSTESSCEVSRAGFTSSSLLPTAPGCEASRVG